MKKRLVALLVASMCIVTACGSKQDRNEKQNVDVNINTEVVNESETQENETRATEATNCEPNIDLVDYSNFFADVEGCAVIYRAEDDTYSVYNEDMANIDVSPYSTFKIVSTLMGLHNQVLQDENTTMNYSGADYPNDLWNQNLTLKEAVQNSCVWYFRQVIDAVGQEEVEKELQELHYGNCNVSEWKGANLNPMEDLNGFWLGSSLQISPMEQVNVIKEIFGNKSCYSEKEINILKDVLIYDETSGFSVYGKTGTMQNKEGWYVGMAQKEDQEYYFAVYASDENNEGMVSGQYAKDIVLKIFESME